MRTKTALVGYGYWGPNILRNLVENPHCEVVAVCDLNEKQLARVTARHPHIRLMRSLEEVLASDAEAVYVATPISTHFPIARAVLRAGKHVFVEKPLTSSTADAEALIAEAESAQRHLMVGHTFEYNPAVWRIRDIVKNGDLGKIFYISCKRVNLGIHQKDVSVIWDLAPHDFSILFYILQEWPVWISATGRACIQKGIPDVAFVCMEFPSGVVAHVELSWLSPSKLRNTTIVGSQQMLVYDDTQNVEKVKIFNHGVHYKDPETFGEFQLSYRTGDILSPKIDNREPLGLEIDHFLSCIREGKAPQTDGRSGLRVVRALECAEASLRNEGHAILLEGGTPRWGKA